MPYTIRKQKCTQSDGDKGTYVLSYTTKKGKKVRNCHTSKKKAQGQIAAIEGPWESDDSSEGLDLIEEAQTFQSHSHAPKVGQSVVNVNLGCKHYGSTGFVVSVDSLPDDAGITCTYCCTNDGNTWQEGDMLTKTLDQIAPLGITETRVCDFSSDLMYHHRRSIPVNENVFRPGSWRYFALIREARDHVTAGNYKPTADESYILNRTSVGEFALYEGRLVPLDFPMPSGIDYDLHEAEYKGRDVKLNKPMASSDSDSKYQVYVRDDDTGNVKLVKFGSKGMTVKIHDMDRRRSFGARHNCDDADDKTKPSYWSCRLPRYWKQLGFKKPPNPSGEWW